MTPNPALGITWGVSGWEHGSTTRVANIMENPGGRSLNAARVADQLSASAYTPGPFGGVTGERVRELFASLVPWMQTRWIASPAPTRRFVALVDKQVSISSEVEQAPPREVWFRCAKLPTSVLTSDDVYVICGSFPGDNCISNIIPVFGATKASSAHIILDTSGTALVDAASYADVLKPNEYEPWVVTERSATDEGARMLLGLGASWTFVSRGVDGMDLYSHGGSWYVSSDPAITGNPIGASDATVAAIATHLEGQLLMTENDGITTLTDTAVTSTVAVVRPTAGEIDISVRTNAL